MSGYVPREGENAFIGDEQEMQRYFDTSTFGAGDTAAMNMPMVDDNALWAHAHTNASGLDYYHPYPAQLVPSSAYALPQGGRTSDPGIGPSTLPTHGAGPSSGYYSSSSSPELLQTALPTSQLPFPPGLPTLPSSSDVVHSDVSFHPTNMTAAGSRSGSLSGAPSGQSSDTARSRSATPHPPDLSSYGTLNTDQQTWTCAYPGCASRAIFARPCDLRKHFRRHRKHFFCRHEGCPQAAQGGFSSKKDRARHEAKHNPGVECEWEGCERIFSRVDNMRNHMQRSESCQAGSRTESLSICPFAFPLGVQRLCALDFLYQD